MESTGPQLEGHTTDGTSWKQQVRAGATDALKHAAPALGKGLIRLLIWWIEHKIGIS